MVWKAELGADELESGAEVVIAQDGERNEAHEHGKQ